MKVIHGLNDTLEREFGQGWPPLHVKCNHTEDKRVTGDFTLDESLALQARVYRVAEAVRQAVPTERVYILSLGSQQGNRHVHWHIAPLPPGVPYREQQLEALRIEKGILKMSDDEMAALAVRIRQRIQGAPALAG